MTAPFVRYDPCCAYVYARMHGARLEGHSNLCPMRELEATR